MLEDYDPPAIQWVVGSGRWVTTQHHKDSLGIPMGPPMGFLSPMDSYRIPLDSPSVPALAHGIPYKTEECGWTL